MYEVLIRFPREILTNDYFNCPLWFPQGISGSKELILNEIPLRIFPFNISNCIWFKISIGMFYVLVRFPSFHKAGGCCPVQGLVGWRRAEVLQ
jgi:hypothetical protein